MPDLSWYRSLYWRIALGFVALLAVLLILQGFVFLWMTGRMTDLFPSRSPVQLAATIATDVAAELLNRPDLDLDAYVNGRYSRSSRGFAVVMADGRTAVSQRVPPPPMLLRTARSRLFGDRFGERGPGRRPGPGFGPGPGPGPGSGPGPGRDAFGYGRGDRPFRGDDAGQPGAGVEFAFVLANGITTGVVAVPIEAAPLWVALRDLGPTLATVALGLLMAGTATAALVIFRPARRRLRELQAAARAIGGGQTGVRAPESGGDEVSSLAHAFNEMAGQLEQRTLALENADRTRRQLLADVSHELTTPLAAVRGYVETLLMHDIQLDAATRDRYLHIVNDETERLDHIVGDLLDLARLEGGGGGALRLEPVGVALLFQRVLHRHGPVVAEKAVTLETEIANGAETVTGDANRLEQALQNLVANAVRHTPPGGTVSVRAALRPGGISLSVDDTGPGIPPEHLARIFDRFYKVDESRSGTAVPSGSGLGLSIVRAIVVRHGGTITASNIPSGGARFEIAMGM